MRLHFKAQGNGKPLVILHGLFGSLNNWNTLGRRLGEHWKVFLVDQRNHGRSPRDPVHTYKAMAADLAELFREQAIPSAHIVGHSMGGKTAMEFALAHPESVLSLVVVDMPPQATEARHDEILDALTGLDLSNFSSREDVDEALRPRIANQAVRQFLLTNLKREEAGGGFAWKMNLDALRKNYGEINRGIDNGRKYAGPVLFIKGGRSPYLSEEDLPFITSLFPSASMQTIPGAGHWVHAEAPEEFLSAVERFISSS